MFFKSERSLKRAEKKAANSAKAGHKSWIRENDNEDPLDLLDPMAIKNVFATKPLTKHEIQTKRDKEEASRSRNRGFKQDAEGRLMIEESEEEEVEDTRSRKSKGSKPDDLDDMMDTLSLSKKSTLSKRSVKKRAMDGEVDSDEDGADDVKTQRSYRPGGSGIHRRLNGKREPVDVGGEYIERRRRGAM